jgi:ubiquinone/menaquinone biosynthesis C-methylase UbiE
LVSLKHTDQWIDKVYRAKDRAALTAAYDQWSASYDADMVITGYLHQAVMTGLVCRHVLRKDAAILDAGVGTGAIGSVLNLMGYNNLTGIDLSDGMLAKAAARKCYADLRKAVLGETLDFVDSSFDAVISSGTFTEGHAPAEAFDELVRLIEKNGVLIFTISSAVWEEKGFRAKLEGFVEARVLRRIEVTPLYQPMPYSPAEAHVTTRGFVYRKVV